METNASFSNDLSENYKTEILKARAIVHFRPSSDWKGEGYGFDWMRTGDYKQHIVADPQKYGLGDVPYREIVKSQFGMSSGVDPSAPPGSEVNEQFLVTESNIDNEIFYQDKRALDNFHELENIYRYRRIVCKETQNQADDCGHYHCSWLSLYPGASATLSLLVEVVDDTETKPLRFNIKGSSKEKGWEYLTVNRLDDSAMDYLKKGFHVFKDIVVVECIREFTEDKVIEVYHGEIEEGYLAGILYIWANAEELRKKLNILTVNVNSGVGAFPILKFEEVNHYLNQAYIELGDHQTIEIPLTETDAGIYFCQYEKKGSEPEDGLVGQRLTPYDNPPDEPYVSIIAYLNARDEIKTFPNKNRYLILYCFDKTLYTENMRNPAKTTYEPLGGGYDSKWGAIVLSKSITESAMTHEILHALGLNHSFSNRKVTVMGTRIIQTDIANPNAFFTYEAGETDNLMDYSDTGHVRTTYKKAGETFVLYQLTEDGKKYKLINADGQETTLTKDQIVAIVTRKTQYTLWKWQWKIANDHINPYGIIIREAAQTENIQDTDKAEKKDSKSNKKEKKKKK